MMPKLLLVKQFLLQIAAYFLKFHMNVIENDYET